MRLFGLFCPIVYDRYCRSLIAQHLAESFMSRVNQIGIPVGFGVESEKEAMRQSFLQTFRAAIGSPFMIFFANLKYAISGRPIGP